MSETEAAVPSVLLTEVVDRIGIITMNRPERRNALNGPLAGALDAAVKQMAANPEVKVVVLTGAAPEGQHGGFCSGGDVKDATRARHGVARAHRGPRGRPEPPRPARRHAAHLMPKATIAMVGGPVVGAEDEPDRRRFLVVNEADK